MGGGPPGQAPNLEMNKKIERRCRQYFRLPGFGIRSLFLALILAGTAKALHAQEPQGMPPGRNELKINGAYLLAGYPELTYERLLGKEASFGLSLGFGLDDSFGTNFGAFPFYRLFFGKKPGAGFFVEGNGAVYSEQVSREFGGDWSYETGAGLGLALGGKFLTQSGWVAELFGGAGRNFIDAEGTSSVYPRLGVSIGKRF